MTSLRHMTAAAALVLAAALPLTACSGDDGPSSNPSADANETTPEEVLGFAKARLDETSGVELTLATDDDPDSDAFLSEASGTITADPPAFEGTASGTFEAIPASDVEIVSVGGKVYANIFGGFRDFDLPKCVPDPGTLLDPDDGVSRLLTDAQEVTAGKPVRGGADNDEVLTPYSATLPGKSVQHLLPCAPGDRFVATFTVDDDGRLRTAAIQGEFFQGGAEITYTISIDKYDVDKAITKP
jgi:lipoprotein LprG